MKTRVLFRLTAIKDKSKGRGLDLNFVCPIYKVGITWTQVKDTLKQNSTQDKKEKINISPLIKRYKWVLEGDLTRF